MSAWCAVPARGRLALSARNAAMRLARRRADAGAAQGVWHPLWLRWRTKRVRPEGQTARAVGASVHATWLSQLHLHFGFSVHGRPTSVGRARRWARPSVTGAPRENLSHYWAVARSAVQPGVPPLRGGAARMVFARGVATDRRALVLPTLARMSSLRAAVGSMTSTERCAGPMRAVHASRTSRASRASDERVPPPSRRRALDEMRPQPLRTLSRAPARSAFLPVPEHTAPRAHVVRRPEMVWRSAHKASTPTVDEAPRQETSAPSRWVAQGSATGHGGSTTTATAAASRALVDMAQLSPSLVDRLADDVIRRVERRVRIDRERRGL